MISKIHTTIATSNGIGYLKINGANIPVKITSMTHNSWQDSLKFNGEVLEGAPIILREFVPLDIERVLFNDPATIVFWKDGTKTVVKCQKGDRYDPEKGLAMAMCKKALGNKGNYCNVFKEHCPQEFDITDKIYAAQRILYSHMMDLYNDINPEG